MPFRDSWLVVGILLIFAGFGAEQPAIGIIGVVIVVLARKFVRSLSCMYDTTEECRRHAASSSTNVTLIGFVLLVVVSVITIVIFELRRDKR